MATGLFEGGVVGAVISELLKVVINVSKQTVDFKSKLDRLESTLKSVIPVIEPIEKFKKELDHPEKELLALLEQLENGKELVRKCSKIACWNIIKRYKHSKELTKLDGLILRFLDVDLKAQLCRDILDTLVVAKDLSRRFDRIESSEGSVNGSNNTNNWMQGCCEVLGQSINTVGLDLPLKELKMMLFNNKEIVHVLSAPGGSGKTTLAKALCLDRDIKGKYEDNIFFVTVSKTPNMKVIVTKLFNHKGYPVPDFQSDKEAANHLEVLLNKLKPKPLFVLDDVWPESKSLLDSFVFEIPDYKVLITSRSAFPGFYSMYKLKSLNDQDAATLFCWSAFSQSGIPNTLDEDLVNKIVRKCKKNSLALKVIGKSLCGKPAAVWKRRVIEWSEDKSILESEIELLDSLRASLDYLDNNKVNLKECFFDFASFPEDVRIPAAALIDIWVGLYKLDDVYAIENLHELSTRNLVDLVVTRKDASEEYSCYNDHFITQHDILRDLAIHQSSQDPVEQRRRLIIEIHGNHFPEWFVKLKNQATKASLLSISTDETFTLNWFDMELPGVEVLVLNLRTKLYTLPNFMEKMEQLKVLVVTNHGFCPAELSNFQVLGSLYNIRRIRMEHISIPFICESATHLKNLRKVSFVMCNIGQAFRNCTVQLSDALPELEDIDIDYCNDLVELPALLCDFARLKKLSITNCHKLLKLPENIGNLKTLEVLRLHACTELTELPDSIGSLHNLSLLDISDCLSLRKLPEKMGELFSLRKIDMRGCTNLSELPSSVLNLHHLRDVFCDEETAYLWKLYQPNLASVRIKVLEENINLNWLH